MFYEVTLFGNRRGSTIERDYGAVVVSDMESAQAVLNANGGNGTIDEHQTQHDAIQSARQFQREVLGKGLSFRLEINLRREFEFEMELRQ